MMDIEDIIDEDVRKVMRTPFDVDYVVERRECVACIDCDKATFDFPCNKCFGSNSKPSFSEDIRDNIIDRVTEQNEGIR